jgi:hypothetical protein
MYYTLLSASAGVGMRFAQYGCDWFGYTGRWNWWRYTCLQAMQELSHSARDCRERAINAELFQMVGDVVGHGQDARARRTYAQTKRRRLAMNSPYPYNAEEAQWLVEDAADARLRSFKYGV